LAGACHGFDLVAPATGIARRALDEQVSVVARALAAPSD
jgi:hypothetical protein